MFSMKSYVVHAAYEMYCVVFSIGPKYSRSPTACMRLACPDSVPLASMIGTAPVLFRAAGAGPTSDKKTRFG